MRKTLTVAAIAASMLALPITSAFASDKTTVHQGDTLSGIARKHHIKGGWQHLFDLNRATLSDPNVILPGDHLNLGGKITRVHHVKRWTHHAVKHAVVSSAPTGNEDAARQRIVFLESSGNPNAVNPNGGAFGLYGILPGPGRPTPADSVATQTAWINNYVEQRYGTWVAALNFHLQAGWY